MESNLNNPRCKHAVTHAMNTTARYNYYNIRQKLLRGNVRTASLKLKTFKC